MSFLLTFVFLSLFVVASPAPAKGIYIDQEKAPTLALFDKYSLLAGKYDLLHHSAVEKEDFYYEQRVNKTVELDRTASTKVLDAKMTYSLINGTSTDDIEAFLKNMADDYKKLDYLVDNMKYRLLSLYQ